MDQMAKLTLLELLKGAFADEIAHLELRMIRDDQAPRFEKLKETYPEIYYDFIRARTGPHEVLLKNRRERVQMLTRLIENSGGSSAEIPADEEERCYQQR